MLDEQKYKYWDVERARKKQTQLSRLANGISDHLLNDPQTASLFSKEEKDALILAQTALRSVKSKFELLKEQRQREEKAKEHEHKLRKDAAQRAVNSLPIVSPSGYMDRERVVLYIVAAEASRYYFDYVEDYLDIDDNLSNFKNSQWSMIRTRRVRDLHDQLRRCLHDYAMGAWKYEFKDDTYTKLSTPSEKLQELQDMLVPEIITKIEAKYGHLIEKIERFNREENAKKTRSEFRAIDGGKP